MYEKRKNTPKESRVLYGITQSNVHNKVQKKQEKMEELMMQVADQLHEM